MTGLLTRLTLKQCKTFSSQVPDDKDSPYQMEWQHYINGFDSLPLLWLNNKNGQIYFRLNNIIQDIFSAISWREQVTFNEILSAMYYIIIAFQKFKNSRLFLNRKQFKTINQILENWMQTVNNYTFLHQNFIRIDEKMISSDSL